MILYCLKTTTKRNKTYKSNELDSFHSFNYYVPIRMKNYCM